MTQIKQTIFNGAVDDGVPQAVAKQIAEGEVKEIERDVEEFKEKVKKTKELIEKARKSEERGKSVVEENTRSGADDIAMDWLLNPSTNKDSTLERPYSERFFEILREKSNLTSREEMLAYVPKNETEKALKETTLLRYEAEDLIAKHPDAADLCGKIFIGAMYGLQGAEYAGAAAAGGPIGVAVKYASQEAISFAVDTTIEESSSKAVEGMAVSSTLREEFKTTLKVTAYVTLCAGSVKASKRLVGTLAKSAKTGKFSLQKTFTQSEKKEILACKANDNAFLVNDNGIYMTKGKVVNGESVGVGRTSSSVNRGSFSGFTASESFGSSRTKKTGATSAASGTTLKVVEKAAKPEIKEGAAKLSGVLSKSKSAWMARFGENLSAACSTNRTQLNWNVVKHRNGAETVLEHVTKNHGSEVNLRKDLQSMFYGDPKKVINAAWNKKIRHNIRPINIPARPNVDYYIIPWENAGCANTGILSELEAGLFPKMEYNNITICTQKGTNNIITAYPSSRTADFDIMGRIAKGRNKK